MDGGAYIIAKKITNTRNHIRQWTKRDFGSIKLKKLALMHEIDLLDNYRESHALTDEESAKDSSLRLDLSLILKHEEIY